MTTRQEKKAMLNEPVLPDDYPIYAGYLYVVDGKVTISDWHDITAKQLKRVMNANEIRRCDIEGRRAEKQHDR